MELVMKMKMGLVLLVITACSLFALTDEAKVKQEAQGYLAQVRRLAEQQDADLAQRKLNSTGADSEAHFKLLRYRIDQQGIIVEKEKAKIDGILESGRKATPEELRRYEKVIQVYASHVNALEAWLK
jgi:hypothetical protein